MEGWRKKREGGTVRKEEDWFYEHCCDDVSTWYPMHILDSEIDIIPYFYLLLHYVSSSRESEKEGEKERDSWLDRMYINWNNSNKVEKLKRV